MIQRLESKEIGKMLNGYIGYLKKSKQGANEPGANHAVRENPESYDVGLLEDDADSDPLLSESSDLYSLNRSCL